jgi:hypothetical protein
LCALIGTNRRSRKEATVTEQQWLACTNPVLMLEFLQGKVSDRKLRLFACACCRFSFSTLSEQFDSSIDWAVETTEWYADDLVGEELRQEAERTAGFVELGNADLDSLVIPPLIATASAVLSTTNVWALLLECLGQIPCDWRLPAGDELARFGRHILYDIFGSLAFRPVVIDPLWLAWNDGTISRLAEKIYDDRTFDRLPILADALEDAGCSEADIVNHCRQPGEHVWGCWVVDLLLGKN